MPVTLPTDADGKLIPFDADAIEALAIKRRGVRSDHSHVTYNLGPDGSSCTRKFSCAWDERFNAAIYFAGAAVSYIDPISGVRKLSRLMPQRDPDYPNWVCSKVELMPWRFVENLVAAEDPEDPESIEEANPGYLAGVHVPVFDRCELSAVFEMVPFDLKSDDDTTSEVERYVTWPGFPGADVSVEGTYVGLPGSVLWYASSDGTTATGPAGVPIPYPVGFVEMAGKIKVVWRRVPEDVWGPEAALFLRLIGTETTRGYIGSVNETAFRGYPPASLQLIGIEQRLLPDPTGLGYSWDLRMIMLHAVKPYGHLGYYFHDTKETGGQSGYHQALRRNAGKTTKAITAVGDDDSIFHVREFADLFKPGV